MHGTILLSTCLVVASLLSVGLSEVSNKESTSRDLAKESEDRSRLKRASTLNEVSPGDEDNNEMLRLLIEKDLKDSEEEPDTLVGDEPYALPFGLMRLDHQRLRRSVQSPSTKEVIEQESKFSQPSEGGEDFEELDDFYPRDATKAMQELNNEAYEPIDGPYTSEDLTNDGDDENNDESTFDKRNMRMLRLGKRPMNMLRLGKRQLNMLRLGKRPMNMLRLGKRPMNMLRLGKRQLNMLRLGKRPMNMLRLGKRPMNMLRLGKRPMNMLRLGKRPMNMLRLGKRSTPDSFPINMLRLGKR